MPDSAGTATEHVSGLATGGSPVQSFGRVKKPAGCAVLVAAQQPLGEHDERAVARAEPCPDDRRRRAGERGRAEDEPSFLGVHEVPLRRVGERAERKPPGLAEDLALDPLAAVAPGHALAVEAPHERRRWTCSGRSRRSPWPRVRDLDQEASPRHVVDLVGEAGARRLGPRSPPQFVWYSVSGRSRPPARPIERMRHESASTKLRTPRNIALRPAFGRLVLGCGPVRGRSSSVGVVSVVGGGGVASVPDVVAAPHGVDQRERSDDQHEPNGRSCQEVAWIQGFLAILPRSRDAERDGYRSRPHKV